MSVKKVLSVTALVAGVYFIGRSANPDLGEVLDYVKANPRHQELVINRTMYSRQKQNLDYSSETLSNFAKALLNEFNKKGFEENDLKLDRVEKNPQDSSQIKKMKNYFYDLIMDSVFDENQGALE